MEAACEDGGSIIKTGAAVYRPYCCFAWSMHATTNCWYPKPPPAVIRIKPGPSGLTNTINRAELVAILVALQTEPDGEEPITIATDSLASIHAIWRAITRPQDQEEHIHRDLLQAIVGELRRATGAVGPHRPRREVHLIKVKSHSGSSAGNEVADIEAKRACMDEDVDDEDTTCVTVNDYCDPFANRYWPACPTNKAEREELQQEEPRHRDARGDDAPPRLLASMGAQLKELCHRQHRLGQANQDAIHFHAYQQATLIADLELSNAMMTDSNICYKDRRDALQARGGCAMNQRKLHWMGLADNPLCKLCGQLDGVTHTLLGCPSLSEPKAARHNEALARPIIRAIAQGALGCNLRMLDLSLIHI